MTKQIDETSKEKAARYVVPAAADRHKQHVNYSDAQDKKIKAGTALKRVKNAGPDTEYGETDSEHAERVNRLSKRRGNAEKEQDTAGRKEANRLVGMYRAGKILAKEEFEVNENLENILVHAWNKDAVNLRDALDSEMQSRISDHVDSMVADVSARLFNQANATENEG
jgi:lactam utilization protein B